MRMKHEERKEYRFREVAHAVIAVTLGNLLRLLILIPLFYVASLFHATFFPQDASMAIAGVGAKIPNLVLILYFLIVILRSAMLALENRMIEACNWGVTLLLGVFYLYNSIQWFIEI